MGASSAFNANENQLANIRDTLSLVKERDVLNQQRIQALIMNQRNQAEIDAYRNQPSMESTLGPPVPGQQQGQMATQGQGAIQGQSVPQVQRTASISESESADPMEVAYNRIKQDRARLDAEYSIANAARRRYAGNPAIEKTLLTPAEYATRANDLTNKETELSIKKSEKQVRDAESVVNILRGVESSAGLRYGIKTISEMSGPGAAFNLDRQLNHDADGNPVFDYKAKLAFAPLINRHTDAKLAAQNFNHAATLKQQMVRDEQTKRDEEAKREQERINELGRDRRHGMSQAGGGVKPASVGDFKLTGDAFVNSLPEKDRNVINGVVSGAIPLSGFSMRRGPGGQSERAIVREKVMQADPSFTENRYKMFQEYTAGPTGKNIVSINTSIAHLGTLSDASEAMKNGNVPLANALFNKILTETGHPQQPSLETAQIAVGAELMRTFRGVGAGSEREQEEWRKNFQASKSPAQFEATIKQAGELLAGRAVAVNENWKTGTKLTTDFPNIIQPPARKVLARLGAKQDFINLGLPVKPDSGSPVIPAASVTPTAPSATKGWSIEPAK